MDHWIDTPTGMIAIQGAKRAYNKWKMPPPSVSLAQFDLESGGGLHMPPGSNNPFGIKAHRSEPFVKAHTTEFVGGRYVRVEQDFKAYPSLIEAFDDHARLIATLPAYAHARSEFLHYGRPALCHALTGVYATDPDYGDKLLAVIKSQNLDRYDA